MSRCIFLLISVAMLFACSPTSEEPEKVDYRALVNRDSSFIGKNIKVDFADSWWDWYLPDLNSSAQVTSQEYQLPAGKEGAQYLRSFSLYDDIGFVWRWESKGVEVFLIYLFLGDNGYMIRTLHNTHNITVDEAILAVFFDNEYSPYYDSGFKNIKWVVDAPNHQLGLEALSFLGEELINPSKYFVFFENRIITLPYAYIHKDKSVYKACEYSFVSEPGSCFLLPFNFASQLEIIGFSDWDFEKEALEAELKVILSKDKKIKNVIAARVFDFEGDVMKILGEWNVPKDYIVKGKREL